MDEMMTEILLQRDENQMLKEWNQIYRFCLGLALMGYIIMTVAFVALLRMAY